MEKRQVMRHRLELDVDDVRAPSLHEIEQTTAELVGREIGELKWATDAGDRLHQAPRPRHALPQRARWRQQHVFDCLAPPADLLVDWFLARPAKVEHRQAVTLAESEDQLGDGLAAMGSV